MSDESNIAPFVVDKEWYNEVPNINDPYTLYATCNNQNDAEVLLSQLPNTKVSAEIWKQNRVLNGFCSTVADNTESE